MGFQKRFLGFTAGLAAIVLFTAAPGQAHAQSYLYNGSSGSSASGSGSGGSGSSAAPIFISPTTSNYGSSSSGPAPLYVNPKRYSYNQDSSKHAAQPFIYKPSANKATPEQRVQNEPIRQDNDYTHLSVPERIAMAKRIHEEKMRNGGQ